ncbi:hypothetical protein KUTeg_022824 [Tegillarca granosa]|uniref:Uncharacterized protein n=1 Tax=Tegillarca granosa TaxID=220873 RepID=A0ABQ9E0C6_TEGGR|nr:hypothetical protein KUTeg_022824 [Tegillarca granosa]
MYTCYKEKYQFYYIIKRTQVKQILHIKKKKWSDMNYFISLRHVVDIFSKLKLTRHHNIPFYHCHVYKYANRVIKMVNLTTSPKF